MPAWVDSCVKKYTAEGMSKDEAWKRCMGAYKKQQEDKKKRTNKK